MLTATGVMVLWKIAVAVCVGIAGGLAAVPVFGFAAGGAGDGAGGAGGGNRGGDGGAGGAGAGGDGDGDGVQFSPAQQAFINKLMKENKQALRKENEGLRATLNTITTEWTDLKNLIKEVTAAEGGSGAGDPNTELDPTVDDLVAGDQEKLGRFKQAVAEQLKGLRTKYERDVAAIRKELEGERSKRTDAETKRQNLQRSTAIQAVATKLRAIDPEAVEKLVRDLVFEDEDTTRLMLRFSKDGEDVTLPLDEGMETLLTEKYPFMLQPRNAGGSGSGSGGRGGGNKLVAEIEALKAQVPILQKKIAQGNQQASADLHVLRGRIRAKTEELERGHKGG